MSQTERVIAMDSSTSAALLSAGSFAAGVIISGFFNFLIAWMNKRSEERRQYRDLVIQGAIANWKQQMEAYAIHQQPMIHVPLHVYILQMMKFADLFLDRELDPQTMGERLDEVRAVASEAMRHSEPRS